MARPMMAAAAAFSLLACAGAVKAQDCAGEANAMQQRLSTMPAEAARREAGVLAQAAAAFADLDNESACRRALAEAQRVIEQPRPPAATAATAPSPAMETPAPAAASAGSGAAAEAPLASAGSRPPPVSTVPEPTAVYFGIGASSLDAAARRAITPLAERAAADGLQVRLRGFTDSTGSRELNLALSRKRVESVAAAFKKAGVPGDRIAMDWEGIDPALPDQSNRSAEKSRRVEIELAR